MERKSLNDEFDYLWHKIQSNENFAFIRNGDGERAIMMGQSVTAQEGWKSPNYITILGKAIYSSIQIDDPSYYIGISCPCCDEPAYNWYRSRIKSRNITFANMWANSNYVKFLKYFPQLKRDAVLIGNHRARGKKIGNLNILDYYLVSDDCISFWDNDSENFIEEIKAKYGNRTGLLYVVSAGPMSGPIIASLFKNNPDNCYVDFGSSTDSFYWDKVTRPYMNSISVYAKKNCWMHKIPNIEPDISVICNLFKKPEALGMQLKALQGQTIKPMEVLLFQDQIPNGYRITLQESILNQFDDVYVSNENVGVWKRFDFARKAKGKYVCLFDDDTIPGPRWLEHCFNNMEKQEGIYGTIGIVLTEGSDYPFRNFFRVGWQSPFSRTTEVDFVGHSWFVKKEWLNYMFEGTEEFQNYKHVAEDMCLSFQAQKYNIKTFVPSHPHSSKDLWGSMPDSAVLFGNVAGSVSKGNENYQLMNNAITRFIETGWIPLYKCNAKYVKSLIKKMKCEKTYVFIKNKIKKIKKKVKRILYPCISTAR